MLIRFRVKNFLSFKDEVELSMIRGKTRKHLPHIIWGGKSRHAIDLLRAAVIYGANASGKSNLIRAVDFAKTLILEGTKPKQPIRTRRFKLDELSRKSPSMFEFEIRVQGNNYVYGFEVTHTHVMAEWLYLMKLTTTELLFERRTSPEGKILIEFGTNRFGDDDLLFLQFVAKGTRSNQLFLTETIDKNVPFFEDIQRWFSDSLIIIFPDTKLKISQSLDYEALSKHLEKFGTGICNVIYRKSEFVDVPKSLQDSINRLGKENKNWSGLMLEGPRGHRMHIKVDDEGNFFQEELVFSHKCRGSKKQVEFRYHEESDGSMRLIDLLPILFMSESEETVVFVDELDRSLHPNLCYEFLSQFLERESQSSQIIVTTHESNLLSLDLLRRDEIWFTEKNQEGESNLYSLEEFAPRYDKDIQKGYLLGRFGAIPIIGKKHF